MVSVLFFYCRLYREYPIPEVTGCVVHSLQSRVFGNDPKSLTSLLFSFSSHYLPPNIILTKKSKITNQKRKAPVREQNKAKKKKKKMPNPYNKT